MFSRRRLLLLAAACLFLGTTLYLQWNSPRVLIDETGSSATTSTTSRMYPSVQELERQAVDQLKRPHKNNHRLPIVADKEQVPAMVSEPNARGADAAVKTEDGSAALPAVILSKPEQLPSSSAQVQVQVEMQPQAQLPPSAFSTQKPLIKMPPVGFVKTPTIPRPCGEHVELNAHFVDREKWHALKPEEMALKRQQWQDFIHDELPRFQYDQFHFKGRGLVYTASGRTLGRALASIRIARSLGCMLPVQVWYIGDELKPEQLKMLRAMNVQPKDILEEQKRFQAFSSFHIGHTYGSSRNYHIKTLVLLLTEFEEILYLDSDNMPLRDPTFLFGSDAFKETGALFWPDFWKFPIDNPIWQITAQRCEDEWEQESGQLVLDKRRSWEPMLLSMFFQKDHAFYFKLILGDKDTFRMAWKILNRPYYMQPQLPAIGGRIRQGRFCGHTMVQYGPDGEILFAHTTSMKTTNALKEGNTWEAIQYLDRVKPVALENPSEHTRSFLVAYPQAMEFSGGIEKSEDRGGVGGELQANPCLGYTIKNMTVETTQQATDVWGGSAVDSFRIVTENLASYEQGRFRWFEHAYYQYGGTCIN